VTAGVRRALASLLVACGPLAEDPVPRVYDPLEVGETRQIVLHTYPLYVEDFALVLDRDELAELPPAILDDVPLVDLPLRPLIGEIVDRLAAMGPVERAGLEPAAANLVTMVGASPDTIVLDDTSFGALPDLAAAVGIPIAKPLSELFQVAPDAPLLPRDDLVDALTEGLVASHPAAPGGALVVTMGDLVAGFPDLGRTFGPADTPWGRHPGVLAAAGPVRAIDEDFVVLLRVDAQALPFAGVDLTDASPARINAIGSQLDTLIDPSRPGWLRIEGVVDRPRVESLTLRLVESEGFVDGSPSREAPFAGPAWALPPWELEAVLTRAGQRRARALAPIELSYALGTGTPVFEASLSDDGWTSFTTLANAGDPPAPGFVWDAISEIAQVRLHDGGIAEGAARPTLELSDVWLGLDAETIVAGVEASIAADPTVLRPLAVAVTENGVGAPDLYYRPVRVDDGENEDWLWFVTEDDIPRREGPPDRPYRYAKVGFFADPGLDERVSTTRELLGDTTHEKVRVVEGDVLYVGDDEGSVFELEVVGKPSRSRLGLRIRRLAPGR